jgi:uncharacterized protein
MYPAIMFGYLKGPRGPQPFVDFREALATYKQLPFKPEVRQKIMHDNAARLLGLKVDTSPAAITALDSTPSDVVAEIVREVMARLKT